MLVLDYWSLSLSCFWMSGSWEILLIIRSINQRIRNSRQYAHFNFTPMFPSFQSLSTFLIFVQWKRTNFSNESPSLASVDMADPLFLSKDSTGIISRGQEILLSMGITLIWSLQPQGTRSPNNLTTQSAPYREGNSITLVTFPRPRELRVILISLWQHHNWESLGCRSVDHILPILSWRHCCCTHQISFVVRQLLV